MKKWALAIFVVTVVMAFSLQVLAANDIKVNINGEGLTFDTPPVVQDNSTLVPMRAIFEALGATVNWDGQTGTVTGTKGNTSVTLKLNSTAAQKNGYVISLPTAAISVNGRILVPLRFISESFDCDVTWNGGTRTVDITTSGTDTITGETTDISVSVKEAKFYRYIDDTPTLTENKEFARNIDTKFGVDLELEHESINKDAYKQLVVTLTSFNGVVKIASQNCNVLIHAGAASTLTNFDVPLKSLINYNEDVNNFRMNIYDGDTIIYTSAINLFYDKTQDLKFVDSMTVDSLKFFAGKTEDMIPYGERTYLETFYGDYRLIGTELTVSYPQLQEYPYYKLLPVTFEFTYPWGGKQTCTRDYYFTEATNAISFQLYAQYASNTFQTGKYSVDIFIYDQLVASGKFEIKAESYLK